MAIFWKKESNGMVEDYLLQKKQGKSTLTSEGIRLFEMLIKRMEENDLTADYFFHDLIKKGKITRTEEMFEGKRRDVLNYMLGKDFAGKYVSLLKKQIAFPYTRSYYRRPVRSESVGYHYQKALDSLRFFFAIVASGLSMETILKGGETEEERTFIQDIDYSGLLSVEIDEGNTAVIEQIKDILCSENNHSGIVTYNLLQGIVMSRNTELYELEGKLLLAAKLQEGLRQSIAETMDSGTTEAFIYLFRIVKDNNLQRFSSIKRAIGTWTGLVNETDADRISQKQVDLIDKVLSDPSFAEACLNSQDTIEVYLGLWIKGFYRVEDVQAMGSSLLQEGIRHKIQVMFYYLRATQSDWLQRGLAKQALELYREDLSIVAAYLDSYLEGATLSSYYVKKADFSDYFASQEEAEKHYGLLKELLANVKEKQTFSPFIFPWYSAELTKQEVVDKMALLVYISDNLKLLDDVCLYFNQMSSYTRRNLIRETLQKPSTPIQIETLTKALGDRAEYPRSEAYAVLEKMDLNEEQYRMIEDLLRFKAGDLRQNAIKLLLKQKPAQLTATLERLITDSVAEKRMAGMDILLNIRTDKAYEKTYKQSLVHVQAIAKPSTKEQVLIEQLSASKEETTIYNRANGFGLFDPDEKISLALPEADADFEINQTFNLFQEGSFFKKLLGGKAKADPFAIFEKLSKLIAEHAQEEFTGNYGYQFLLGNNLLEIKKEEDEPNELNRYPLADLWREFYTQEIDSFEQMLQLYFASSTNWGENDFPNSVYETMDEKFLPEIRKFYGFDLKGLKEKISKLPYADIIKRLIPLLAHEYWDEAYVRKVSRNILLAFLPYMDKQNARVTYLYKDYWHKEGENRTLFIYQHSTISFWFGNPPKGDVAEKYFNEYFTLCYLYYQKADYLDTEIIASFPDSHLSIFDFSKAYMEGLIPETEVIRELMVRIKAEDEISNASTFFTGKLAPWRLKKLNIKEDADFSGLKEIMQKVTTRILDIELKRGDSATEVSKLAMKLERIEGAHILIAILKAFGKDTFGRSDYYYNSKYTKKEVLSKLLRCCFLAETDTVETLAKELEGSGIKEERLVEAGMYAPQWLEMVEACIGWQGLYSAGYYFHAHLNEWCDDRKKAIIARFTPIDVEDLKAGAFDINWFKEAYNEIGEKRFDVVYDAAKYISSGTGHTRARKYADAVNGKLEPKETKKQIADKRNKDLLMAYCLIPLNKKSNADLLERYQYLQQFLKESKTFGAQRQESEKKAVNIGMQNLARNAGYSDVTRLTWSMETALIKEMQGYFTPKEIEGVEVYVSIDEEGKSSIHYVKAGKELNSAPAKLKKDAYIAELKDVHKKLKDQYSRSRLMLEQSMEDETFFLIKELEELTQNPVVWPLLKHLIFVNKKGEAGFYHDKSLVTADGETQAQKPTTEVRIAHPFDLYKQDVWANYQRYLFDNKIRQPFKQVFRELYVKTEEERPMTHSLRYAGHQIQPQKTVAVLKSRRWVANYEEGLQKIYYKENIVASIYALADWFSPADAEAPTLEWVAFHDRKTYKQIPIEKIPDILFSEVMRDVDLAVSVAHVGGVDPEASHSTIEMRRAIVEFTMPLFKLTNVRFEKNFAFITGTLGNYNIHLGSGVIHQEAGSAIAVLPVHSQHRGRLFLPFVDEDPKTAEILSKIILFAEDQKIKDPFILDQIKKKK
ncbi:hypothetical protein M2459_000438 [Parabacteroides sp. PF5-5]|uniref:DUF4132 domain-containing protein n=1 Tax=unclassified Parabacteroides TaxID=2649774 RepID=UPI002472F752|nr:MULTISPECIES: DUF4132 domain-containing protein [unclassified Parabacteroides]MDH6303628.1 hypothetical protein [Parabacteroides sp. PH5-39]MDH6314950.1 hypothetical protein [Parabacteroides sp. PF5-13]MDH6318287.1 hypothetical protein [Parabacteroides sp. PH5-13]MDH6321780.1 hypothetical protein [Parabacteroides sp. PH5-8]MDH6325904.1 hypothetical protein [Parabacteroides sp. PH5-41]